MSPSWDFGVSKELALVEQKIRESIQSEESLLTDIASYVIEAGCKRIRPTVALLSFKAVGGRKTQDIIDMAAAFELIHSATLIHDDINDGGYMRRGKLAAYRKFGIQNALVTGDFLFAKGFAIGGKFSDDIVDLTAQACTSLAEGEIRQKRHMGDLSISEGEYIDIIRRKTAMPISVGAKIGALLGGGTSEEIEGLGDYGRNLGIAFQIVDDILDVIGSPKVLGKGAGSDIKEGNVTLLIIHALNNGSSLDREFLARAIKKKRNSEKDIRKALQIIKESGAVERARLDAIRYANLAKKNLEVLPNIHYKNEMINLVDFVLKRDS